MSAAVAKTARFVRAGGEQISLTSERGAELVEDLTRWAETLFDDKALCSRWDMSESEWQALKRDAALVRLVRRRKAVREATGVSAREAARSYFNRAPKVLHDLMADTAAPGRTRIDAARELRQAAGYASDEETRGAERFTLTIIIGDESTTVGGPVIDPTLGPQNLRSPVIDLDALERRIEPPDDDYERRAVEETREEGNFTSEVSPNPFEFDLGALGMSPAAIAARQRDMDAMRVAAMQEIADARDRGQAQTWDGDDDAE